MLLLQVANLVLHVLLVNIKMLQVLPCVTNVILVVIPVPKQRNVRLVMQVNTQMLWDNLLVLIVLLVNTLLVQVLSTVIIAQLVTMLVVQVLSSV
jgi:hypothetical protein